MPLCSQRKQWVAPVIHVVPMQHAQGSIHNSAYLDGHPNPYNNGLS